MTGENNENSNNTTVTLDPLSEMNKRLEDLRAEFTAKLEEKDKKLAEATKNASDLMQMNKDLYARAFGQNAPNGPTPAPKPKSYDEIMYESLVDEMKNILEMK